MRYLVTLAGLLLAGLLAGALLGNGHPDTGARAIVDYAQAQATVTALAQQAAAEQAQSAVLAPVWTGVQVGLLLLLLAGAAAGSGLGVYALWRRVRLRPLAPLGPALVDRAALHSGHYDQEIAGVIAGHYQAAIEQARNPALPPHFHYAPHTITHQKDAPALPAAPELAAPPVAVPTLGQAVAQGLFRQAAGYLQGFTLDGLPLWLPADEARSFLGLGHGGCGKSTMLLCAILGEYLLSPALRGPGLPDAPILLLADYHARKPQSLTQRAAALGGQIAMQASTPEELARLVAYFEQECQARIDGKLFSAPLVLVVDEITNAAEDGLYDAVMPAVWEALRHANNAYRAVGGKAIVGAHTVQSYSFGGHGRAATRQSFHARAAMRTDAGAGTILGFTARLSRELPSLAPGHAFVQAPGLAPTHIISPNVTPACVAAVLDTAPGLAVARTVHPVATMDPPPVPRPPVAGTAPGAATVPIDANWWEAIGAPDAARNPVEPYRNPVEPCGTPAEPWKPATVPATSAQEVSGTLEPCEATAAARLFLAGFDIPQIVKELRGIDPGTGGRRYQDAAREVQALIRAALGGPVEGAAP